MTAPTVIASSPYLSLESWAPDSSAFAFRTWTEDERDLFTSSFSGEIPVGELHFYFPESGQSCTYPDRADNINWQVDGKVIVVNQGKAVHGTPCHDDFIPFTLPPEEPPGILLSPDGRYRAVTVSVDDRDMQTGFEEVASGATVMIIEWVSYDGNTRWVGTWLTPDHFLMSTTEDAGPRLVDVAEKRIHRVAEDLFKDESLTGCSGTSCSEWWIAHGARESDTNDFHLLLTIESDDRSVAPRLYHSTGAAIETIPFPAMFLTGFTPDGKWLVAFDVLPSYTELTTTVWFRRTNAPEADWATLTQRTSVYVPLPVWSPQIKWVALNSDVNEFKILSFPDLTEAKRVQIESETETEVHGFMWAPNERWLASIGTNTNVAGPSAPTELYLTQLP